MSTRVAVVTGSNKGIGLSVVKLLVPKFTGDVILTARDVGRGEAAVKELETKYGLKAKFHQLDIENVASITALRDHLKKTYGGLDVLINNAGMAYKDKDPTPFSEQAQNTIKVNYMATLKVCEILFPILRPHARVVNVSSAAGMLQLIPSAPLRKELAKANLTVENLNELVTDYLGDVEDGIYPKVWGSSAYVVSKVFLSALTRIHQRQFNKDPREDLVINCCHPGYVDTDMTSHKGKLTTDQGAVAPVYLATLPPGKDAPRGGKHVTNCHLTSLTLFCSSYVLVRQEASRLDWTAAVQLLIKIVQRQTELRYRIYK